MTSLKSACTIREYPPQDQPHARMHRHGANTLTDTELLAMVIRRGTTGCNAIDVARDLLQRFGGLHSLGGRQIAENINTQKKSAIYVQKKTSGENEEAVTPSTPEALEDNTAMEVGGIEPPSENVKVRTSTCVAHFLNLVPESSNRRDLTGTSLSFSLAPCPKTQHGASLPYRRS